jgi:hypothetical protein
LTKKPDDEMVEIRSDNRSGQEIADDHHTTKSQVLCLPNMAQAMLFETGNNAEIFAHNVETKGIDLIVRSPAYR